MFYEYKFDYVSQELPCSGAVNPDCEVSLQSACYLTRTLVLLHAVMTGRNKPCDYFNHRAFRASLMRLLARRRRFELPTFWSVDMDIFFRTFSQHSVTIDIARCFASFFS